MKIKSSRYSRSKIKIGGAIIILFVLNIAIVMVLSPVYWRLLTAEAPRELLPQTVAVSRQAQQKDVTQQMGSPSLRRRTSSPLNEGVPAIGEEKWLQKYSAEYKGLLPSSTRDSSDPICGTRPDFFEFFVLPKSQR